MFCKNCGSQIADGTKFCPSCGKPTGLGSAGSTPNPGSSPAQPHSAHTPSMPAAHAMGRTFGNKFNIGNIIVWAGCVVAMLSLFLNFASVSVFGYSESITLIKSDDGIFFVIIILAVAVVNFFRLHIVDLVISCIGFLLLLLEFSNARKQLGSLMSMVDYGAGRTVLVLGLLLMIGGSIAGIVLSKKAKKAAGI